MPCRNYEDDIPQQTVNCDQYKNEANKWEAAFCALVNEVDRRYSNTIMHDIFSNARKNSGINIKELFDQHLKKDIDRLERDLNKYSPDELNMIKLILNKNEKL